MVSFGVPQPKAVVPRVRIRGLIRRYSVNYLRRLLTPSMQTKVALMVDRVLQIEWRQAMYVPFSVMVGHVMITHALLGTTNERCISSLGREDQCNGDVLSFSLHC